MANVHTLNDASRKPAKRRYQPNNESSNIPANDPGSNQYLRRQNQPESMFQNIGAMASNEGGQFLTLDNLRFAEANRVMFLSGRKRVKNPKDENYWDMLMEACCPVLKCFSWTIVILIIDLAMFIISLSLEGGFNRSGTLLAVNGSTLILLGGNQASRLRDGQVYRLLGAMVLHADFLHFFGNAVTTLIFVSRVQYTYGFIKTGIFYVICGIGGNIFSALINPGQGNLVKVGASTALYGVLGLIVGYVVINWYGLDLVGPLLKCQLVCVVLFVLMFVILFTSVTSNIDVMGHIGGFLTGLFLTAAHQTLRNQSCEKAMRVIFISLLVIMFLLCFLLFYLLPRQQLGI